MHHRICFAVTNRWEVVRCGELGRQGTCKVHRWPPITLGKNVRQTRGYGCLINSKYTGIEGTDAVIANCRQRVLQDVVCSGVFTTVTGKYSNKASAGITTYEACIGIGQRWLRITLRFAFIGSAQGKYGGGD